MNNDIKKLMEFLKLASAEGGQLAGGAMNKMGAPIGKGMTNMANALETQGVKSISPTLASLGDAGLKAGNYMSANPAMALGGAGLGALNVAGLADGEDILAQLLAGAGGAGLGYAKGGIPGAVMGGLGGGAAGDILPKLIRMLQGNNQEMNM
jgi:hypothetical protein